jgi:hypothetical protein
VGFFEQRCSCIDYDGSSTTSSKSSNNNAAIIGLAVGLGVPLLLALIIIVLTCVWCCWTGRWRADNIKHLAGTIIGPKQQPVDKTPAATAENGQVSPPSPSDNTSELFWTPEMPGTTAVVNRGYDSQQNTIRNMSEVQTE